MYLARKEKPCSELTFYGYYYDACEANDYEAGIYYAYGPPQFSTTMEILTVTADSQ